MSSLVEKAEWARRQEDEKAEGQQAWKIEVINANWRSSSGNKEKASLQRPIKRMGKWGRKAQEKGKVKETRVESDEELSNSRQTVTIDTGDHKMISLKIIVLN